MALRHCTVPAVEPCLSRGASSSIMNVNMNDLRELLWRYNTQEDEELEQPVHPLGICFQHVATRGSQAEAILGLTSGIVTQAVARDGVSFPDRIKKHGARGLVIGGTLMAAVGAWRFYDAGQEGIEDRGLRLKHNGAQNKVDRYAFAGAAAGALTGAATGSAVRGVVVSVPFALAAYFTDAAGNL